MSQFKDFISGIFGGKEKEAPRPRMCPACGYLVGISATTCPNCGTNVNFSLAAAGRGVSGIFGGNAPVTTGLLVVNLMMFAVTLVSSLQKGVPLGLTSNMDNEVLYRLGESNPGAIYIGHQWFRLVTAIFLHLDVMHIAFNMWVLWDIGPIVEEVYGSARYLFLYTVTGICGFILSSLLNHNAVGASTALMGLIGLMLAITTKRGGAIMKAEKSRLIFWIAIIFGSGLLPGVNVDNWGHLGGVASGFLLGRVFADRQPAPGNELKRAYALGWLAALIIVTSFAFMIFHVRD